MENEDKIVELLSESLKRQDQMIERMDKHEDLLNRMVTSVDGLADLVKHSLQELKRIDALEERLRRIERHTGLG